MADTFGLKLGIEGEKEFKNALRDINASFKVLTSEMNLATSSFEKNDKSVQALAARNTVLNRAIDTQKEKIALLKEALANASDSFGEGDKRTQAWAVQLNNAQAELNNMERELVKNNEALGESEKSFDGAGDEAEDFGRAAADAGAALDEAGDDADEFGAEITDASEKTSIFGDVLRASLAADAIKAGFKALCDLAREIGGALKSAIDTGIEFESAFAGVKKTVEATDEQLAELEHGIRAMALELPMAAAEIAGIAENAGQLGIKTENVLVFTRTMADLGNATNLTGEEAAKTFAQFANITGMDQGNFDRLGSSIVALGNNFATTEADIAAMGQNLAAAGSQVGMSQADIMGLATALSSMGVEAQAGGTAFSKVMVNMQVAVEKGGDSLSDFAKVAGVSADEFAAMFREDATGAIIAFTSGLANAEDQGKSAIGILDEMGIKETRLRDSLLRAANASDVFTDAIALSNQAWDENSALTNEAAQRYETMESQLQIFQNSLSDFGIEIYQSLQAPMMDIVQLGTTYISQLTSAFQEGGLQGLVEETGTVLADILAKISEYAPMVIDGAMAMIRALIEGLVEALPGITSAATEIILTLVEGLIGMLPLLLEGAIQIVVSIASGIGESLPRLIPTIVEVVVAIVQTLADNLPLILDAALQLILGLAEGLLAALPVLIEALPALIDSIVIFLLDSIPLIIEAGITLLSALVEALPTIIAAVVAVIPQIIGGIITAVIAAIPQLIDTGIRLLVALIDALPQIIATIVRALPQIITGIVNGVIANIDKIILAGVKLLVALVQNIPAIIAGLVRAVPTIINGIVRAIGSFVGTMASAGLNLMKGLAKGILDAGKWLWDQVKNLLKGLTDKIKGFFGISSRSKLFYGFGSNLAEGLGDGFTENMNRISRDMLSAIPQNLDIEGNVRLGAETALDRHGADRAAINQTMNVYSPKPLSERELAREFRNMSRKLALEV